MTSDGAQRSYELLPLPAGGRRLHSGRPGELEKDKRGGGCELGTQGLCGVYEDGTKCSNAKVREEEQKLVQEQEQ